MNKLGTKILNSVVTLAVTVVFSGLNLLAPVAANAAVCPTLNPGDMIKVTGKPAIYVVNNNLQVQYFPSGYVFKSWRPTYGGYTSVSMACFDSLNLPTNPPYGVNFAPGSYVIKRPSSDQLYVVEPGNVKAKITTEAAKALYGNFFQPQVINDEFWPNYPVLGNDVTEAKPFPGFLFSNKGTTWYMDVDGKARQVTATGLTANGFQTAFVHPVADAVVAGLQTGATIDAEVKSITDKTQSGGVAAPSNPSNPSNPSTPGGSLSVSLSSDNPFAATVVSDSGTNGAQAMVPVLKLNFSADNSGDVKVTTLSLKRAGVSADTDIANMYLYDDAGVRLAGNPSVANNIISFTNSSGLFTVTKGTTKSVKVLLDLKNAVSAGKTFQFVVADAASVTSNATGSVGGTFPLTGNVFTTASVTDLGKLTVSSVSPSSNTTVDPGTTGYEIWRLQAVSSNQDIEVRKLVFTIVGSINVGDIQNISLWDGSKQLGATVVDMAADKTVTFDLAAAPYVITKGQTKTLSLKADIKGGTNRSFRASLQNGSDVVSYDKNYNVYLKTNGTDSFSIVQPNTAGTAVNISVNTGTLTQTLAADSPTGNIALNATGVTLARFAWQANGEDIKVSSLNVSSTISSSRTLTNVRLMVNDNQVGTTISTLTGNGVSNSGWGTFGNSFIIKAGTTAKVEVRADLTGSAALNDTVVVGLPAGSSNAQGVVSLSSLSTSEKNANTLTVKSGTVSVSLDTSFGNKTASNPNGTINASGAKVGSFIITSGAGEFVKVSGITLTETASNNGSTCVGSYMQNLTLKDAAGKTLGTAYANPSATCSSANSFNFTFPEVTIEKGAQYVVGVYADLKAAFSTAATSLIKVDAVTATGGDTNGTASVSGQALALQYNYISTAGNFTVATDSNTPVSRNLLMGAVDQELGRFNITASTTEAINITELVLSNRVSSAATGTLRNVRLYDNDNGALIGSAVPSFTNTNSNGTLVHAVFSGLKFQVPKGNSKVVIVKADLTTYDDLGSPATTGQTANLAILKNYTGSTLSITATGASSGVSITPTVINSGTNIPDITGNFVAYTNTSTLYRAKLTTAWSTDTPSGAAGGSASQIVGKFVITNLANAGNYSATVQSINFDLSTTISNTADRALTVYKDSIATGNIVATTSWLAAGNQNFSDTAITDAGFTDVSISSGQAKTFWVTLDTSNAASTKNLSIRIGSSDVSWTDGVNSGLTVMDQDLPLQFRTFTY